MYFCTSKASKLSTRHQPPLGLLPQLCQYLYFCTSKASKVRDRHQTPLSLQCVSIWTSVPLKQVKSEYGHQTPLSPLPQLCQYLYFCTSKASKVRVPASNPTLSSVPTAAAAPKSMSFICIRQHTSAYVSIRQHTSAYGSIRLQCQRLRPRRSR